SQARAARCSDCPDGGGMNRHRPLRSLAILALLPLLGVVFWLTAVVASSIPSLLVVDVNVHGLTLATYAGDSAQRVAPLSLRVLDDANQDALKPPCPPQRPGAAWQRRSPPPHCHQPRRHVRSRRRCPLRAARYPCRRRARRLVGPRSPAR